MSTGVNVAGAFISVTSNLALPCAVTAHSGIAVLTLAGDLTPFPLVDWRRKGYLTARE